MEIENDGSELNKKVYKSDELSFSVNKNVNGKDVIVQYSIVKFINESLGSEKYVLKDVMGIKLAMASSESNSLDGSAYCKEGMVSFEELRHLFDIVHNNISFLSQGKFDKTFIVEPESLSFEKRNGKIYVTYENFGRTGTILADRYDADYRKIIKSFSYTGGSGRIIDALNIAMSNIPAVISSALENIEKQNIDVSNYDIVNGDGSITCKDGTTCYAQYKLTEDGKFLENGIEEPVRFYFNSGKLKTSGFSNVILMRNEKLVCDIKFTEEGYELKLPSADFLYDKLGYYYKVSIDFYGKIRIINLGHTNKLPDDSSGELVPLASFKGDKRYFDEIVAIQLRFLQYFVENMLVKLDEAYKGAIETFSAEIYECEKLKVMAERHFQNARKCLSLKYKFPKYMSKTFGLRYFVKGSQIINQVDESIRYLSGIGTDIDSIGNYLNKLEIRIQSARDKSAKLTSDYCELKVKVNKRLPSYEYCLKAMTSGVDNVDNKTVDKFPDVIKENIRQLKKINTAYYRERDSQNCYLKGVAEILSKSAAKCPFAFVKNADFESDFLGEIIGKVLKRAALRSLCLRGIILNKDSSYVFEHFDLLIDICDKSEKLGADPELDVKDLRLQIDKVICQHKLNLINAKCNNGAADFVEQGIYDFTAGLDGTFDFDKVFLEKLISFIKLHVTKFNIVTENGCQAIKTNLKHTLKYYFGKKLVNDAFIKELIDEKVKRVCKRKVMAMKFEKPLNFKLSDGKAFTAADMAEADKNIECYGPEISRKFIFKVFRAVVKERYSRNINLKLSEKLVITKIVR